MTLCRFQYCQFARSSAVSWVSSLLGVKVQCHNPVCSSETGPAVQQELEMRQFSGHHISRLGNKNHPSFRELVCHRFSAFWLRSSVVSVLLVTLLAAPPKAWQFSFSHSLDRLVFCCLDSFFVAATIGTLFWLVRFVIWILRLICTFAAWV